MHAKSHQQTHLARIDFTYEGDNLGVIGGLEQTGHHPDLKLPDDSRSSLNVQQQSAATAPDGTDPM